MKYRILIIASHDSFLKAAINTSKYIPYKTLDICIHTQNRIRLSNRQLLDIGIKDTKLIKYSEINVKEYSKYDLIIISVGNKLFRSFIVQFYNEYSYNHPRRPLIISVFGGVIFGHIDSILSRIDSDIILANSLSDKNIIKKALEIYKKPAKTINFGLANIHENQVIKRQNGKNIIFIDQVKIPKLELERKFVISKLLDIARNNKNNNIILKIRKLPNEVTVHDEKYPYIKILESFEDIPNNFIISSEPISKLLPTAKIVISFSSTVILESIYYGIPSFIIKDLGIRKDLENHHFLNSNLYIDFNDLNHSLVNKEVNKDWYFQNIYFSNRKENINKAIENAIKKKNNNIIKKDNLFGGGWMYKENSFKKKLIKLINNPKQFILDSKILKFIINFI